MSISNPTDDDSPEPSQGELLDTLAGTIRDYAIFFVRPDGTVGSWSSGAERMSGFHGAQIVGQPVSRLFTVEDIAAGTADALLQEATACGLAEHLGWLARAGGAKFRAEVVLKAIVLSDGRPRGFAASIRDLTALHKEQEEREAAVQLAEQLRKSQEQFRQTSEMLAVVLSGVTDGITLQAPSGKLVYANEVAAQMTGYGSAKEMLEARPAAIFAAYEVMNEHGGPLVPDDMPGRAVLRGGKGDERLVRFRVRATGQERWSLISASPIHDQQGRLLFALNLFRDVTQRQQQEEALRVSREWFATALRSIGDAVVTTDARGEITFMNAIAEELTGWTVAVATGKPLDEVFRIVNEDTRQTVESPVARVIRDGVIVGLANHTILIRRDKSELSIDDSAAPIRDGEGRLVGVVLVFRDVTAKRREDSRRAFVARATVELNSSLDYEATLATIARFAVPTIADWCAVDILEGDSVERLAVAHVDPAKLRFVGEIEHRYPPDPNAPNGVRQILRTGQPEMIPVIPRDLLEAAARDPEHLELIRQLSLRSYMGVPLKARDRTLGVITFVMAESNRQYGEEDLAMATTLADRAAAAVDNARLFRESQRARFEAELANRSKDEFLAMLGHELRNPLAPIFTALHLMKLREGTGASLERERSAIERQVKHLVRLVDDLLDVSRITRGKVELHKEPLVVSEVVARAIEMASPLIEARQHELAVSVSDDLMVEGDAVRLAQIMANLLNNAAKYTEPRGRVSVTAAREGAFVRLSVADSGIGITPQMLGRIFDPFVQEPQALDRSGGGLGLGLAIVRSLVSLHGGTVEAHSEGLGRCAQFVVRLPILDHPEKKVAALIGSPAATVHTATSLTSILVVDDNVDAAQLLADALETLGHQCHVAHDGPTALLLAPRVRASIAILDIGLPVMDGYELAKRLRALPGGAPLKLVAVTGYGQSSDRERSAKAGFDEHFVKPLDILALDHLLKSWTAPAD